VNTGKDTLCKCVQCYGHRVSFILMKVLMCRLSMNIKLQVSRARNQTYLTSWKNKTKQTCPDFRSNSLIKEPGFRWFEKYLISRYSHCTNDLLLIVCAYMMNLYIGLSMKYLYEVYIPTARNEHTQNYLNFAIFHSE